MKKVIIHPFLFVLFPVFSLISANAGEVFAARAADIFLPILVSLAGTGVFWLFAWAATRSAVKSAIITSVFVLMFFSYGYLRDSVLGLFLGDINTGRHRYLLSAVAALFAVVFLYFWRTKKDLSRLTSILNKTSVFLVAISLFGSASYFMLPQDNMFSVESGGGEAVFAPSNPEELPDIYYVILDGYAAPSTLRDVFERPIDDFTDYLRDRGFYVPEKSLSNYALTNVSFPSSLNMRYVNEIGNEAADSTDPSLTFELIENNAVQRFLKERGYKFVNVGSWWVATSRNRYADLNINPAPSEFWITLKKTTILDPLDMKFGIFDIRREVYDSVFRQFDSLRAIASMPEPTFTFAHILIPHPPYMFNADGSYVTAAEEEAMDAKDGYANQVEFLNGELKKLVDNILVASDHAPIIVFQGDHGSNHRHIWEEFDEEVAKERMRIFNAYHLPDGGEENLYETITPVNSFRVIFNRYFGTDFEILPDRSYFSSYASPYKFMDVTDIVSY